MSRFHSIHFASQTGQKATAAVIFLHGSGGTGELMKEWVQIMAKNFTFPHVKVIYPTAPLQPYTPNGGSKSNVWFDRLDISPTVPEKIESIDDMENSIKELIEEEKRAGIPIDRIIVGGFSMGGALAFHIGYRWQKSLAGVFAFSSFLNKNSIVCEELKKSSNATLPPLLQIHGDSDELVDFKWGKETYDQLKQLGVSGDFHSVTKLGHSINRSGLMIIKDWIEKLVPVDVLKV